MISTPRPIHRFTPVSGLVLKEHDVTFTSEPCEVRSLFAVSTVTSANAIVGNTITANNSGVIDLNNIIITPIYATSKNNDDSQNFVNFDKLYSHTIMIGGVE